MKTATIFCKKTARGTRLRENFSPSRLTRVIRSWFLLNISDFVLCNVSQKSSVTVPKQHTVLFCSLRSNPCLYSRKKQEAPSKEDASHFLAEREGFEPSCACAQTDFESAPLWPLRYLSVLNYKQKTCNADYYTTKNVAIAMFESSFGLIYIDSKCYFLDFPLNIRILSEIMPGMCCFLQAFLHSFAQISIRIAGASAPLGITLNPNISPASACAWGSRK